MIPGLHIGLHIIAQNIKLREVSGKYFLCPCHVKNGRKGIYSFTPPHPSAFGISHLHLSFSGGGICVFWTHF